jgi:hypothetical protein
MIREFLQISDISLRSLCGPGAKAESGGPLRAMLSSEILFLKLGFHSTTGCRLAGFA